MFVVGTIGIALVIMNIFVIPTFAEVFQKFDAELPWQTQVLIGVSDFFNDYWMHMLVAAIGAHFFTRRFLATPKGRLTWGRWKLTTPIVGSILNAQFLLVFVTPLQSSPARVCR